MEKGGGWRKRHLGEGESFEEEEAALETDLGGVGEF